MGKWIKLPVEFKGIWISPQYGGFHVTLRDRFNPEYPPDRLYESFEKKGEYLLIRRHAHAKPTWITRKVFEEEFGKVELVLVDKEKWNDLDWYHTPGNRELLIYTEKYVVSLAEYDGWEEFIALPRNPPPYEEE